MPFLFDSLRNRARAISLKNILRLVCLSTMISPASSEDSFKPDNPNLYLSCGVTSVVLLGLFVIRYLESAESSRQQQADPVPIQMQNSATQEQITTYEQKESIFEKRYEVLNTEIQKLLDNKSDTNELKQLHTDLEKFHKIVLCPISHEIYSTPATVSSGITYGLDDINHYLKSGKKCPTTNIILTENHTTQLRPNVALQQLIEFQLNQFEKQFDAIKLAKRGGQLPSLRCFN